jgi:hypothetical protein
VTNPPKRRYELALTISADNWDGILANLATLCEKVEAQTPGPVDHVSGSPDSGRSLLIEENVDQTPEQYQVDLRAWKDAKTPALAEAKLPRVRMLADDAKNYAKGEIGMLTDRDVSEGKRKGPQRYFWIIFDDGRGFWCSQKEFALVEATS